LEESFEADKTALKRVIPEYSDVIYAITVGSEALYRGNLTGLELLTKIKDVNATFPGIKVGTADSWNKYVDGSADALITGGVKLL
jgi:glucan 1,3-beta-glucosidase